MELYFDVQRTQTQGISAVYPLHCRKQEAEAAPTPTLASPIFHAAKFLKTGKRGQPLGTHLSLAPTPVHLIFLGQGTRISNLM